MGKMAGTMLAEWVNHMANINESTYVNNIAQNEDQGTVW